MKSINKATISHSLVMEILYLFKYESRMALESDYQYSKEFLYQALALIVSIILVHATYVSLISPEAKAIIAEQQMMIEQDINYVPDRSFYVIVRDFEQEACFILMLWAFAIMAIKANASINERRLLREDLIPIRV